MARDLDLDELLDAFTLTADELKLLRNKSGATRLGFAVTLRFLLWRGRFPRGRGEVPDNAIAHVAKQAKVEPSEIAFYDWQGRSAKRNRTEIREFTGFGECSVADAEKVTLWLAENVCDQERNPDRVRQRLLEHCKEELIEPPEKTRIERIVRSALSQAEDQMMARAAGEVPAEVVERMLTLIGQASDDPDEAPAAEEGPEVYAQIKDAPGNVSLKTLIAEKTKLEAVRAVEVPHRAFARIPAKMVAAWRDRAAAEAPSHLRGHPHQIKVCLLGALLWSREREITDTLVDLVISTVHKINARAEKVVTEEFVRDLKRVSGKEDILFRIAEASVGAPESPVREVVYPAAGGEQTLQDLLAEFRSKGTSYRQHKQRVFKSSYSNHYRAGLLQLLDVLEFHSSNDVHRPLVKALELICRYREVANNRPYYDAGEHVPVDGVIPFELRELLHRTDKHGRARVLRTVYECGVFQTLREQLRCKEIWVVGADRWRNPDEDLPADFADKRVENYRKLNQPLDPEEFITRLHGDMVAELSGLNDALPRLGWVEVAERKAGAISLSPLEARAEPRNLRRLKKAVRAKWGVVPLLDMLKETALRTGMLEAFTGVGTREAITTEELWERLILVIYAYGTNTGLRRAAAGEHAYSEDDLRYIRRRYFTIEGARNAARAIANATFAIRSEAIWGQGSTAVGSDSTHVKAFDQNLFTEWHSRYGGRGVLIYWHIEERSMAVHSQLLSCSASEVHAMVEGAMRHGTSMNVEANYVDSHGQSEIGFGITRLLGFKLLPRIKQINRVKLYQPDRGDLETYPLLRPAMTRPIRWDLIAQQYDQMIKYATAIRLGTASTEAILRRFTRNASHPTYAAMLEVGRAEKTAFCARYLRDRDLQYEVGSGLNVVENSHGIHGEILYGKTGELSSNRREEQELTMLALHILQACLVYVNTLMLQEVLAEPEWQDALTAEDRRGLTPLFSSNMNPYGDIRLNMGNRLALGG
ncbi:Tn3 family transposase [Thermobifida cellulosilytica]|uniref:Transposase n=1 Tax=Thermobifida cellulosilytica TB100 TaxID=665004 RepID=A0A147KIQ4_THECS|nr:Tn3 family transposase [Thermobifida cellulosilytica]KUP97167.1 transposase [Thermobifida cellulosilytica TB100]